MQHSSESREHRPDITPAEIVNELRLIATQWQAPDAEARQEQQLREREVAVMAQLESALANQSFTDADKPALLEALEAFGGWADSTPIVNRIAVIITELRGDSPDITT